MFLYPEDIFSKLEFSKILDLLSNHCVSTKAASIATRMQLFKNKLRIERSLNEVLEYKDAIALGQGFIINNYQDIDEEIYLLSKENYTLDAEQHFKIFAILKLIYAFVKHFDKSENEENYPSLFDISLQVEWDSGLMKSYRQVFDDEGKIKPDASPELAAISRSIRGKEIEIDKVFNQELAAHKRSNFLSDTSESYMNGRRVLSVQAENKRKVKGIIHNESATGKTVFIEPEPIILLNNILLELHNEKRQEIFRILRELTNKIRPGREKFDLWQKIIVRMDLIHAKAKFAIKYQGQKVEILDHPALELKHALHPLLLLINDEQDKKTIPFDLELSKENSILVISGPNAGGKSVTMKAVGLIQLMLQAGMLVPVAKDSKMGLFDSFLADIGDQQSLEEDLSTYSSRLINMETFVRKANAKSMVLIDEFGSGTDPQAGGAIAEAILDQLVKKRAFGVITTHYSNIKMYGYNSTQIVNGAMLFDQDNLRPKYVLETGKPGSSFAFEIASKIGLQPQVLKYAKKKSGKHNRAIDDLLLELQSEKEVLTKKLEKAENEKKNLSRLIHNYEQMSLELEMKRKRLKLKEKESELSNTIDQDKAIQAIIRKLKEEKNLEKAKDLSNQLRTQRDNLKNQMRSLNEEAYKKSKVDISQFKSGDYVKLNNGESSGQIISIKKKKAVVQMGVLSMEVPLVELIPAKESMLINSRKSIKSDISFNSNEVETKIDLRGYTKNDALDFFQDFVDQALLSKHTYFEVLHGKGNGILRNMVLKKLKEYKDIKRVWHPSEEFGGNGITKFEL